MAELYAHIGNGGIFQVEVPSIGIWPFDNAIQDAITENSIKTVNTKNINSGQYHDQTKTVDAAGRVFQSMVANKYDQMAMPFVLLQTAFETGDYTSPAFLKDNNASGISPDKSHPHGASKWRHFDNLDEWAKKMKQLLLLDRGAGAPMYAKTLNDYVHRLKKNGYFEESEAYYLHGLDSLNKKLSKDLKDYQIVTKQIEDTHLTPEQYAAENSPNWFSKLSMWEKIGVVVTALIGIKIIVR